MKRKFLFPALAFAGGGFTYILRLMQNLTGFEADTGLPVAGNLWSMLLPAALALVLAAALLLAHRAPVCKWAPSGFEASFSSSSTGFLMLLTAGVFLLGISGLLQLAMNLGLLPDAVVLTASGLSARSVSTGSSGLIEGALTLLTAGCLFSTLPACRRSGSREAGRSAAPAASVNGLLLVLPVIAMVVRLVLRYRQDSVNPTLIAYYIPLLALVLVTMALYLLAGFAFQSGNSRTFLLCAMAAVVLCITALADDQPLYSSLFHAGFSLTLSGYLCLHVSRLRMI
ncbi:MAG: hypothetical protein IJ396_02980 [Oscillibacter sp.]|nr:hypothetical protein [Oscillibacter sp.]